MTQTYQLLKKKNYSKELRKGKTSGEKICLDQGWATSVLEGHCPKVLVCPSLDWIYKYHPTVE